MHIGEKRIISLMVVVFALTVCAQAEITVDFPAGTPAGWDFQALTGDIARNNAVGLDDLSIIAQYWLNGSCGSGNNWCTKADINKNTSVDLDDYALLATGWGKQAGSKVLLQTIYGTAQNSASQITANVTRPVSKDKGLAMAFAVSQSTLLDKGIFKCTTPNYFNCINIHFYNVTGKGYLTSGHTMAKADPGSGSSPIFDVTFWAPMNVNSVPYHTEGTGTTKYTDMVINFDSLPVTAGEYLMTFDVPTSDPLNAHQSNTWGNMVRANTSADVTNMGNYPDGTPLPKKATATVGSTTGNTYWYQLDGTDSTSYTGYSNLFAFQITTTTANNPPQVDAGIDQRITTDTATLNGIVTDDGQPDPPAQVHMQWTKILGPGTVTFADASAADTTATFSDYGTYLLRLTANDGKESVYDEVVVAYCQDDSTNQPPSVDVGADQQIMIPAMAILDGTVADDNSSAVLTTLWTVPSGPGDVTFNDPNNIDTWASFSAAGTYVLRLTANDGDLSNYDELTVTVTAPPAIMQWKKGPIHFHTANSNDSSQDIPTQFSAYRTSGGDAFACVTDHDWVTDASPYSTSGFLGVSGIEISNNGPHVIAFGVNAAFGNFPYIADFLQPHIDAAIAAGGLPMIAHPYWSQMQHYAYVGDIMTQLMNMKNCNLIAVYNDHCQDGWGWGFSETYWDQLLSAGKVIYGYAEDDSHSLGKSGRTFNMVGATELTVPALKQALKSGASYFGCLATQWGAGITITDYSVTKPATGGVISITTNGGGNIIFIGNNGATLQSTSGSSATYNIVGNEKYVRIKITSGGNITWTQPVFVAP